MIAIFLGMALGLIAAWKANTCIDFATLDFVLLPGRCQPSGWESSCSLPVPPGWGCRLSENSLPGGGLATGLPLFLDVGKHLILPTLTLSVIMLGEYMLIMRSTSLEIFSEDYILTAKAKGLKTFNILKDHVLRNAMLPMVTIIALNLGFTVAGAIQIESVFSWPGLGLSIFEAVGRRDYPMLQGSFLMIAITVIFANLLAELMYSYLDPRVQAI